MNLVECNNFKKVEYNTKDNNAIKNTQKILSELEYGELPSYMFKSVFKSMMNDAPVVSNLCETIYEYVKLHKSNLTEEFKMTEKLNDFIENIKSEKDFVKGIIVQEEICNVWIIIKEACFRENKKYFEHAREYKEKSKNIDFNITIFSEEDIEEIKEELKSYSRYEVF